MKILTLKNRLSKRYKGSKTSKAYQVIVDLVEGTNTTYMVWGNIIRPCHVSGSGRYTKNMDYTEDVTALLDLLGVKYQSGNDAPKGGKPGNFILIKTSIKS
jgi:hypothetical protein